MDASSLSMAHLEHLARMQGGMKNFGVPVVFISIPGGASAPSKQRTQSIAHGPSGVRRWAALPRRSLSCISQPRHVRGQLALMRGSESDGVREFIPLLFWPRNSKSVRFTRDRGTNFTLDTRTDKHDAREREGNRRNYSLYDDKAGRGNEYVHGPQGLSRSLTKSVWVP